MDYNNFDNSNVNVNDTLLFFEFQTLVATSLLPRRCNLSTGHKHRRKINTLSFYYILSMCQALENFENKYIYIFSHLRFP